MDIVRTKINYVLKVLSIMLGNVIITTYIYYVSDPLLRCLNYLIFIKPYEEGIIVISILQIRKLRLKKIF